MEFKSLNLISELKKSINWYYWS